MPIKINRKLYNRINLYLDKHYIKFGSVFNKIPFAEWFIVKKERLKKRLKNQHEEEWKNYNEEIDLFIKEKMKTADESFREMLFRKIHEKGLKDSECYQRANFDKRLFSKIRRSPYYHPKKTTVVAFAIALKLDLDETKELLISAGYALTHTSKFDIIIEYCINKKIYNINTVNEILYDFDQALLGCSEYK